MMSDCNDLEDNIFEWTNPMEKRPGWLMEFLLKRFP